MRQEHSEPVETERMRALRECSVRLEHAGQTLFGHDYIQLFNKIKGLQGEVDSALHTLLIPPAP